VANVPWHLRKIPGGDLLAGRKPDVRFSLDVIDKLAERRDAMRLANDVGVQPTFMMRPVVAPSAWSCSKQSLSMSTPSRVDSPPRANMLKSLMSFE
jgi:hypothetical protein